jgi:Tfp pilus assembly protein PilX
MQTHFPRHSRCGSRDGVALLAVLACILLLTILIVSYISFTKLNHISTAEYGNSVQAQEIAQGGLQDIVTDLHQEIVAGSSASTNAATFVVSGTPVYVPTVNLTAVPARVGYAASAWGTDTTSSTFAPSLVRVSRRDTTASPGTNYSPPLNTTYYPGTLPLNRASAASTATASTNGRTISPNRWNKPMLLVSTGTANIPSSFTTASTGTTGAPDWVYVTRTGSRVCQVSELASLKESSNLTRNYGTITPGSNPPVSPVVGRYAFVMYDEGALLDANVAGSPSTLINNSTVVASTATAPPSAPISNQDGVSGRTLTYAGKSYQSSVDLMQLTGFSGTGATGQAIIDSLIALRNTSVGGGASPVNGPAYLTSLFQYASYGFTSFTGTTTAGVTSSDAPFLSRQDLINYFSKIDSNINTSSATYSKALPYLGTFSRAVSAPTYSPPIDSNQDPNYNAPATPTPGLATTAPVAYKDNAENPGNLSGVIANRDLANVRFANTGTVTHYYDDQTGTTTPTGTATYSVSAGDPLLQNRFSLAKLNWLTRPWAGEPDPGTTSPTYTSSNFPAAIQACFGLYWGPPGSSPTQAGSTTTTANGGNPCWNYVGSPAGPGATATAFTGTIETLDQVAQENREPNFFELLKAAILSGSLGLGPGHAAFADGTDNATVGEAGSSYDVRNMPHASDCWGGGSIFSYTFIPSTASASTPPPAPVPQLIPDVQIIQIGANIIDQYSPDSYPTAIYFPYHQIQGTVVEPVTGSAKNALFGPVDMVYGEQNLPELSKIDAVFCCPNPMRSSDPNGVPTAGSPSVDDNAHSFEGWLQPEIWNPHQEPASALANEPHKFEIRAYGSASTWVLEGSSYLAPDMTVVPNGWTPQTPLTSALQTQAEPGPPSTPVAVNWIYSNSPVQSYYTGVSSTETSSTGTNEQAGTIDFTDTSPTSSFYLWPQPLVSPDAQSTLPLVTVCQSPLPSPSAGTAAGENITDTALNTFPYYNVPMINAPAAYYPVTYNHFVAFSAGVISDQASSLGNPYMPFWQPSGTYTTMTYPGYQAGLSFPVTASGIGCTSYALGWIDSGNRFHPYNFITGAFQQCYDTFYDDASHDNGGQIDGRVGGVGPGSTSVSSQNTLNWGNVDPRTGRFFITGNFQTGALIPYSTILALKNSTLNASNWTSKLGGIPSSATNVSGNFNSPQATGNQDGCFPQDWIMNATSVLSSNQRITTGQGDFRVGVTYYADPDGVVRPADGLYSDLATGDGVPTLTDPGTGSSALGDKQLPLVANSAGTDAIPMSSTSSTGNARHGRRPVILNRPFRSVGELGYVFRDLPFKTLDFFSPSSADAALLDVFSLTDESKISSNNQMTSVVAGQVSLNNAPLPVIMAMIVGGSKKDLDPTYNFSGTSGLDGSNIAGVISNYLQPTSGPNPILNRAALVTQIQNAIQYISSGAIKDTSRNFVSTDKYNKAYFEAPIRALADITNTRTWNLMIDIIAQSGEMSPTAQTLNDFVVQGEKRYWLHIAIDRYTGKIVAQQLEPVYE